MKLCLIYNPASGHNRRRPVFLRQLRELSAGSAGMIALRETQHPGHACALAREAAAEGFDRIVAVGGDGTMNETAQGLIHAKAALALVPCGSGNGLALHLGIPTDSAKALALATDPTAGILSMDTGDVNGHPFFNVMGAGLDAEISLRFNRLTRRGLPSYVRTTIGAFLRHRSGRYRIETELGEALDTRSLLIAVANSSQYGNNAIIAPGAQVNDGVLNVTTIEPMGFLALASLVPSLFKHNLHRHRRVRTLKGASLLIERESEGPLHTDGETHLEGKTLRVRCLPGSLRIVVPAETLLRKETTTS